MARDGKKIFVSYRRQDSEAEVRDLRKHLVNRFGQRRVFVDLDGIRGGQHYPTVLKEEIGRSKVLLVIIGDEWLNVTHEGRRRLEEPEDSVRIEIEEGLKLEVLVIPVLVQKSEMPPKSALPASIGRMAELNARELRGRTWEHDMDALMAELVQTVKPPIRPRMIAASVLLTLGIASFAGIPYLRNFLQQERPPISEPEPSPKAPEVEPAVPGANSIATQQASVDWKSVSDEAVHAGAGNSGQRGASLMGQRIINVATSQLDTREEGENAGTSVTAYLKSVGLAAGDPWSAAFVQWVVEETSRQCASANPLEGLKTGSGQDLFDRAKSKGFTAAPEAVAPGDIFLNSLDAGKSHVGIVTEVVGTEVRTIEGNTNESGNRDGDGVFRRTRRINSLTAVLKIPLSVERKTIMFVGPVEVYSYSLAGTDSEVFGFTSSLVVTAGGAPNAYAPDDIGLDSLANAGKPGNWWGLATDDSGNPFEHAYGGKTYYVSMTALQDVTFPVSSTKRYVDSTKVPYVCLPLSLRKKSGMKFGDIAYVRNNQNGSSVYAIVADISPASYLGEGSIALAKSLGVNSDPKRGGVSSRNIQYWVFKGSGTGKPMRLEEISEAGLKLKSLWGGLEALPTK